MLACSGVDGAAPAGPPGMVKAEPPGAQQQQHQEQQLRDGCSAAAAAVEADETRKLLAVREAQLDAEREAQAKLQRCAAALTDHARPWCL